MTEAKVAAPDGAMSLRGRNILKQVRGVPAMASGPPTTAAQETPDRVEGPETRSSWLG